MEEDILHQIRVSSRNSDLEMNEEIHNRALLLIEDMCYLMSGSLLVRLGMPAPNRGMNDAFNRELERDNIVRPTNLKLILSQANSPLVYIIGKFLSDNNIKL